MLTRTSTELMISDGKPVLTLKKQGNRDLKWETSKNLNAGFEISLFSNRISLNADYFERKVSDMIYTLPLPPSNAGSYVKYGNIGDMTNKGIQANINVDILRTDDFSGVFMPMQPIIKTRLQGCQTNKKPQVWFQDYLYWLKEETGILII
jgi:outer membrane receptor protein involved in Fe transport